MQQNNFNDIRIDTGKKIKKIFGKIGRAHV